MKLLRLFLVFFSLLLIANCGSDKGLASNETSNQDADIVSNETKNEDTDRIAFIQIDSGNSFQLDRHGKNLMPLENRYETPKKWENQLQVLNTICSQGRPKMTSMKNGIPQYETPITVFSPDGALLGSLEDTSWEPAWSPSGEKIAVACGADENGDVVVVSNYEHQGSSEGWSRSGRGKISDRIEIFVTNVEGSSVTQITNNESGDWLPRWFPYNTYDPFDKSNSMGFLPDTTYIGFAEPIILETNRAGKSEILVKLTTSTDEWQISKDYPKAQSPVWSKNGDLAAFRGGEREDLKIVIVSQISDEATLETSQSGIPISWKN